MKSLITLSVLTIFYIATDGTARADDPPPEVQVVDALNKTFGVHPGYRANHAKGTVVEGSFKAFPIAQTLSKTAIFSGATIPITVRFSDSTGIPNLPDGGETDMAINSLKFFPVATGEEFRDLFLGIAVNPPGAPKPTRLDEFATSHPTVPAALATIGTPDCKDRPLRRIAGSVPRGNSNLGTPAPGPAMPKPEIRQSASTRIPRAADGKDRSIHQTALAPP